MAARRLQPKPAEGLAEIGNLESAAPFDDENVYYATVGIEKGSPHADPLPRRRGAFEEGRLRGTQLSAKSFGGHSGSSS
jgi:hypothetical protein